MLISVILLLALRAVKGFDYGRFFIPTQEGFVAQKLTSSSGFPPPSSPEAKQQHQVVPLPPQQYGWPASSLGPGIGSISSAFAGSSSSSSSTGPFTFPGLSQNAPSSGMQLQPQFFGGTFGLGFVGGGWYPYPLLPQHKPPPPPPQPHQQFLPNLQYPISSSSASASAAAGGGWGQFPSFPLQPPAAPLSAPLVLRPSPTGWDTSYNVPCGVYQIRPFVVANLRLATSSSPFGRRRRRSPFLFSREEDEGVVRGERQGWASSSSSSSASLYPAFFPPPAPPQPNTQAKTCQWQFHSDGRCRLKFKCHFFQLPALVSCSENFMQVTDTTPNLNSTFCGNRKPRKVYQSSNGRLYLTFRSGPNALPALFDCAVVCTNETPGEEKPNGKLTLSSSSSGLTKQESGFSTSTETEPDPLPLSSSPATSPAPTGTERPSRVRIGDCQCGVATDRYLSKGRIVGGSPASPLEFPWTVALVRKSASPLRRNRPFCGGSLINDRYVLSAAHCVQRDRMIREPRTEEETLEVILLEHDVARMDEVPGGSIRASVDRVILHPDYDNVTFHNDVALLRLASPLDLAPLNPSLFRYQTFQFHSRFLPEVEVRPLTPKPSPVCLPLDPTESLEDRYGTITGWGLQAEGGVPSDELMKATVQIFNDTLCRNVYKEFNYPVTPSMLCAGFMGGQVDACVGDSGGGLVVKERERHTLVGITSWGRGCGRRKQPGVYTKIQGLTSWIRKEAGDGIWCP